MKPSRRRRRHLLLASASVLAVALGACSVESDDPPAGAPTTDAYPAPPAPATAPGVTDDSITIGFTYPDLETVRQFVDIDHGDYEAVFQALVDKVNENGGINGRTVVPVYGAIDLLAPAGAQRTCVRLTEDEDVFAVLGTFTDDDVECYVQTHETIVVGGELTAERYARARAPWVSDERGGGEIPDGLRLFAERGALAGDGVGVVSYRDDQAVLDEIVLPTLRDQGIPVTETAVLDADLRDPAAVNRQASTVIQKFQAAGVTTVLLVGGSQSGFPTELEKTNYRPTLLFTDMRKALGYVQGSQDRDLSVLDGALTLGSAFDYAGPANKPCVTALEAAMPELTGKFVDPATEKAGEPSYGTSERTACNSLTLFQAIAEKAGRELTYESFQQAALSLSSFDLPTYADSATYSRQTPHGAIPPRVFTFDPDQKTFVLSGS
ncbi:ABC transporter substrate-binding protein [Parafrankia sp. EUN1f]|uniref:ABC transporter substrate-binding protein n=1 Tax=Parafrankia sp. EUN1f TaxID=102897 RepID=UPI0001C43B09|nr:ABC transporter substrate-binding protein [Parafrankia sp. EUN1f]EFC82592.1 hypothetical protein FrEUN1fDRAFT_4315 [Parafrankia sp. EUN1f]